MTPSIENYLDLIRRRAEKAAKETDPQMIVDSMDDILLFAQRCRRAARAMVTKGEFVYFQCYAEFIAANVSRAEEISDEDKDE